MIQNGRGGRIRTYEGFLLYHGVKDRRLSRLSTPLKIKLTFVLLKIRLWRWARITIPTPFSWLGAHSLAKRSQAIPSSLTKISTILYLFSKKISLYPITLDAWEGFEPSIVGFANLDPPTSSIQSFTIISLIVQVWWKRWDSNSRDLSALAVFKTTGFNPLPYASTK